MPNNTLTRRTLMAATALTFMGEIASRHAWGKDAGKLSVTDPKAVALGYVEDASKVDAKKYPAFAAGQNCENCLQLQGTAGNSYRPCSLFPGSLVAASGWCSGWTAEM